MFSERINCPNCGRFMKWHSSSPDDKEYKEWYTCVCNGIHCKSGKNSVLISSMSHWGKEQIKYRGSTPNIQSSEVKQT